MICEREYEVGAWLRNPHFENFSEEELVRLQDRRLDILKEMLGFDRQRMLAWALAQAVLSAWWALEDHGDFWQESMRCAQAFYELM